jgi:ubiquinone/menaquinone biosynthesis C-methylase UbiE
MCTHQEVRRLAEVYRAYRESQATRAQWNDRNPGNHAIREEWQRVARDLLTVHGLLPLTDRKILEVGCGTGKVLADMVHFGAQPDNLYGVDLLADRITEARQAYPDLCLECANAEHLEFQDASFDLVLLFTVFSSILDEGMARNVGSEVRRVLRPGGAVLWYDFRYNNPQNPNVRGITRRRIHDLFPGFTMHLRSITLLPLLARRLGRFTKLLYPVFSAIPPLRTHYLGLLVKPESDKF